MKSLIFTPQNANAFAAAERARVFSLAFHAVMTLGVCANSIKNGIDQQQACADAFHNLTIQFVQLYPNLLDAINEIDFCAELESLTALDWMTMPTEVKQ